MQKLAATSKNNDKETGFVFFSHTCLFGFEKPFKKSFFAHLLISKSSKAVGEKVVSIPGLKAASTSN